MEAGKVRFVSTLSRQDVHHTLHTYFHSIKPNTGGRKRLFSFVQVEKPKTKRLFGNGADPGTLFVLCSTISESSGGKNNNNGGTQLEMHYVQLLSDLSLDVRHSWNLKTLETIECPEKQEKQSPESLTFIFSGETTSWHWTIDRNERPNATEEFLWSVAALLIHYHNRIPRLVQIHVQELQDKATLLGFQQVYNLHIDLTMPLDNTNPSSQDKNVDNSLDNSLDVFGLRFVPPDSDDALTLLNDIDWTQIEPSTLESDFRKQLQVLEDENIAFLLSLNGETKSGPASVSMTTILKSIDTFQDRMKVLQDWTNESDEALEQLSHEMQHFETLNNQLELHFKNSVTLEQVLTSLMDKVTIAPDQMQTLTSPVSIFPEEKSTSKDKNDNFEKSVFFDRLKTTSTAIETLTRAIECTKTYPASEMLAFQSRGDELATLATTFGEHLCVAFDTFLTWKIKHWTKDRASLASSPTRRERRELSSSASRIEMDWQFTTDSLHQFLVDYTSFFSLVQALDAQIVGKLQQIYAKHLAGVYMAHFQVFFKYLTEQLPRPAKHHFYKPATLPSRPFHLSSSHLNLEETMCASPLLQQALDHVLPLVLNEQHSVSRLFFSSTSLGMKPHELEEQTILMEQVMESLPKRLKEFGDAAASRTIFDALALVVLVNGMLDTIRPKSAFFYNVLVAFQLQLKRLVIKFTEKQEAWIRGQHVDTKMAGVLAPIRKMMSVITRMEESAAGKSHDSTLVSLYNLLVPATMHWIDQMADSRPKYAALTRLENFHFLSESLEMVNSSKELPLAQYAAQAQAKYTENLQTYVAAVWEYAFKQLVPLVASIEILRMTLPAVEIAQHSSRVDFQRVLDATASTFEKSVRIMHDRMKKHFRANPKMLVSVWKELTAFGTKRLTAYAVIAGECFQLRFDLTPERGLEVLNKLAFT